MLSSYFTQDNWTNQRLIIFVEMTKMAHTLNKLHYNKCRAKTKNFQQGLLIKRSIIKSNYSKSLNNKMMRNN